MKRTFLSGIYIFIFSLFSIHIFATSIFPNVFESSVNNAQSCSVASDITSQFCATSGPGSFSAAVQDCCPLGPIPMNKIYNLMVTTYGSLQAACNANAKKYGGTVAACMGQWNCYWHGGKSQDMNGLCDGNGQACATL